MKMLIYCLVWKGESQQALVSYIRSEKPKVAVCSEEVVS